MCQFQESTRAPPSHLTVLKYEINNICKNAITAVNTTVQMYAFLSKSHFASILAQKLYSRRGKTRTTPSSTDTDAVMSSLLCLQVIQVTRQEMRAHHDDGAQKSKPE